VRVTDRVPGPDPAWNSANLDRASSGAPYRLYNIGSNRPIELLRYIEMLEHCSGRKAKRIMKPLQLVNVLDTFAEIDELIADIGYKPDAPIEAGLCNFLEWFKGYYGCS
jgi:UDP-glucuronate 4-epimerase